MKAMVAVSMVRIDQDGCQFLGWNPEIERQIFVPVTKRPEGVRNIISGGLKG